MHLERMTSTTKPRRGDIWLIEFDPQVGTEISKRRPAVVINEDSVGRLPLRIVVPVTDWKDRYSRFLWFVKLHPTEENGLSKVSGADGFQVKSVSIDRFLRRIGILTDAEVDEIVAGVALCIGYVLE